MTNFNIEFGIDKDWQFSYAKIDDKVTVDFTEFEKYAVKADYVVGNLGYMKISGKYISYGQFLKYLAFNGNVQIPLGYIKPIITKPSRTFKNDLRVILLLDNKNLDVYPNMIMSAIPKNSDLPNFTYLADFGFKQQLVVRDDFYMEFRQFAGEHYIEYLINLF